MKIIEHREEINELPSPLKDFVYRASPWLSEDWDMEEVGFIYVLGDEDIGLTVLPAHPLVETDSTFELTQFEEWEFAELDKHSRYWNAVAVISNTYGLSIFCSEGYVETLPGLKKTFIEARDKGGTYVE